MGALHGRGGHALAFRQHIHGQIGNVLQRFDFLHGPLARPRINHAQATDKSAGRINQGHIAIRHGTTRTACNLIVETCIQTRIINRQRLSQKRRAEITGHCTGTRLIGSEYADHDVQRHPLYPSCTAWQLD